MYQWQNKNWPFFEYDLACVAASINEYRAITGASSATATRDLKALVNNGLLRLTGEGKRGLRYFVNFPQQRDLFKPEENTNFSDNAALNKLLRKITRNID